MQNSIEYALKNARKTDVPDSTFTKVDAVLRDLEHRKDTTYMKPKIKRSVAIAAVIAAMLAISGTAYAIYQYSLRDLALPEESDGYVPNAPVADKAEADDGTGIDVPKPREPEHGVTIISLQGYTDSPEYKALAEWNEFLESYDKDGLLLNEADAIQKEQLATTGVMSIPGIDDHYWMHYRAYTREMADKLDEIAQKYNLELQTEFFTFNNNDEFNYNEFIEYVAHGDFLGEGCDIYPGYAFDSGTFQFSGSINGGQFGVLDLADIGGSKLSGIDARLMLNGTETEMIWYNPKNLENPEFSLLGEWLPRELIVFVPIEGVGENGEGIFIADNTSDEPVLMTLQEYGGDIVMYAKIGFQMRSCRKGTLDIVGLNIGNLADYNEWIYKTASGVMASLSQSNYKSLIIVETDDAFIGVNVMEGTDNFSAAELEALADAIDFTLLK